MSYMCYV